MGASLSLWMMMMMALVCLQAKHVAGLPAAAEGRQILLRLLHQQLQQEEEEEETAAAARCQAGVASFHDQVLLLHCAPVDAMITSTVSFHLHNHDSTRVATGIIDLAAQLRRPSPSVLSFVLGAGAVLSLTLHHRLLVPRSSCSCLIIPGLMLNCLRMMVPTHPPAVTQEDNSQSSSCFITIEKGTISRRRPPSDNLLTTDDDEGDDISKPTTMMALEEEQEVEDEFLAKLEAEHHSCDLDALIKDLYL